MIGSGAHGTEKRLLLGGGGDIVDDTKRHGHTELNAELANTLVILSVDEKQEGVRQLIF